MRVEFIQTVVTHEQYSKPIVMELMPVTVLSLCHTVRKERTVPVTFLTLYQTVRKERAELLFNSTTIFVFQVKYCHSFLSEIANGLAVGFITKVSIDFSDLVRYSSYLTLKYLYHKEC